MTSMLIVPYCANAQEASGKKLGQVHFETSCNDAAQRHFDRAMTYQHSFWYNASVKVFEEAFASDSACAIAYWGIGLSLLTNPHGSPPPENLPLGLAALQKGKAIGAKTQRERDYIDSLMVLYADHDKTPWRQRVQAYLKAAEELARRYPNDDEAQINYAITLNVAASPADKTYAYQLKGAALLDPILKRQPQHPGVAHYLIHLYDYPPIAEKGLAAASLFAKIAAAAPHAQHMPSHIYTRVGYWKESIASNLAALRIAKADKEWDDQMHGMDYLVYAYLQLAQDKEARAVISDMRSVAGYKRAGGDFAMAASAARYPIERGEWKDAAALEVRPSRFIFPEAVTHFARALGAARSGDPQAAKVDVEKLTALIEKLKQAKNAYWAEQADIQRQVANSWILFAEGKHQDALTAMAAAADAEDKTEKSPITPGPLIPARELYGAMLLERGMAKEALAAFEATLKKEPNRFNTFARAAQAAEKLGDKYTATAYYQKMVVFADGGTGERPALAAAKHFLARK